MALKVTAAQYAEKWGRRTRGSTEDVRNGVNRVTVAPGELAVKNKEAMVQNFVESVNSGVWERAVTAVTLPEWKEAMLTKGLARLPAGVDAALPKVQRKAEILLPIIEAAADKANAMPKVTLEDSIARMTTFVREMAKNAPNKAR